MTRLTSVRAMAAGLLVTWMALGSAHGTEVGHPEAIPGTGRDPISESGSDADPNLVQRGKELYAHHCSHCHGFNMVNPGTVSFDLRKFPHNDKPRFVNSVTNGKNGVMPPWSGVLSAQDLDAIWAYVLTGGHS